MNHSDKHLGDIAEIKEMMTRSSRFLSLSGWSGISSGLIALAGSVAGWKIWQTADPESRDLYLLLDAGAILILAVIASVYFSWRKARRSGAKLWSPVTRRLTATMMVPLITGALLSAILFQRDLFMLIPGITLIFYGLALVSTGRFTNREAVMLGLTETLMGLFAVAWTNQALLLWAVGFGLFHLLYGLILYIKYDR